MSISLAKQDIIRPWKRTFPGFSHAGSRGNTDVMLAYYHIFIEGTL